MRLRLVALQLFRTETPNVVSTLVGSKAQKFQAKPVEQPSALTQEPKQKSEKWLLCRSPILRYLPCRKYRKTKVGEMVKSVEPSTQG